MFKHLAIIPIVTSVALAQTTPSSLIPSGISDPCSTFLNSLNTNNAITTCTSLLTNATSAFGPGGNAKNVSSAQLTSTLSNLCSSSTAAACPSDVVGGVITQFYSACSAELTSKPNDNVRTIYDTLFTVIPLQAAICALDDGGNYCSMQAKLPASTNGASLQAVLSSPSPSNPAALIPNVTAFSTTGLPFLFLNASLSSTNLCNVCTRKIMNAYLSFEAAVPYAPGLGKSVLLGGQVSLYTGIENTCGSSFLDAAGVVKAAGGLAGGTFSSGAVQINGATQGLIAMGLSILALFTSSLL